MKLIIEIDKDYYEIIKFRVENGDDYKPYTVIAKGEPYEERPKGEWIVLVDADNIQTCKCSICGRMVDIANREFDKFPYCHCGAKMQKGGVE